MRTVLLECEFKCGQGCGTCEKRASLLQAMEPLRQDILIPALSGRPLVMKSFQPEIKGSKMTRSSLQLEPRTICDGSRQKERKLGFHAFDFISPCLRRPLLQSERERGMKSHGFL